MKADKTTNYYKTEAKDYVRLVEKNVTKTYKKTKPKVPDMITLKDKKIVEKLELDDRVEVSASWDSFKTLKDHKPDFINNPTCRLINPSKSEIGIISKNILDRINKEIIQATKVNLWKSTNNNIEWFNPLTPQPPVSDNPRISSTVRDRPSKMAAGFVPLYLPLVFFSLFCCLGD